MELIIKNGRLVSGEGSFEADIFIADGKIERIDKNISLPNAEVLDAAGRSIFPGFIDPHTHLDMETGVAHTADDFLSGTHAALAGGTTTVLDFATQNKGETLTEALKNWHALADGKSGCDYGFHMAITDWNDGVKREIAEMPAQGVTSYKLYMAYDALRVTDAQTYEVLCEVKKQGGIVGMHCENGDLVNELIKKQLAEGNMGTAAHPLSRPDTVEAEAINRYIAIAELADCPVNIVHLSSQAGLEVVLRARRAGRKVYVETCPQYLLLDDMVYMQPNFEGAKYVMSPPLRKKADEAALWQAVEGGDADTIGTDHCPFMWADKQLGREDFSKIPNGAPGVELRPQLIYTYGVKTGRITEEDMCRLLAENPAKLFGMYPYKGALAEGADADIVIWDGDYTGRVTAKTQHSRCDFTPYEGFEICGRAEIVLLHGQMAVRAGEILIENGGRYVKRGACRFWR